MFDRPKVRAIREKLNEALAQVGEELGLSIATGSASFTANNITFKLQVSAITQTGEVLTREAEDFKVCCFRYGLKPEDLHKQFRYAGCLYTIMGCKPRSYRFPILAKDENDRMVKVPAAVVKVGMLP